MEMNWIPFFDVILIVCLLLCLVRSWQRGFLLQLVDLFSWLVAATDYVRGFQAALLYTQTNQLEGLQAALGSSICKAGYRGVQASTGYNYSDNFVGLQAGAVNTSADFAGLQASALVNVADKFGGLQASLVVNVAREAEGMQAGLYNQVLDNGGFQAGLINIGKGKGFQLGLINYNEDAPIPFLPFVNFSF